MIQAYTIARINTVNDGSISELYYRYNITTILTKYAVMDYGVDMKSISYRLTVLFNSAMFNIM